MRSLCEMCFSEEASIPLPTKGKVPMMVCPGCKQEVDDRLTAERGMAAERARLFRAGLAPKANWGTAPTRKRGRPRKQDVPDMETELTEGDSE